MTSDQVRAQPSPRGEGSAGPSLRGMRFGLPGDRGDLDPESSFATLELARVAERLGYDCLWFSEEHFAATAGPARYTPLSPLILAAAVAAVTRRIRIGFTPLFPSLYHPIRIAEDVATLDRVSGGRVDFGIGWPNATYIEAFGGSRDPASVGWALADLVSFWGGRPLSLGVGAVTVEPSPLQRPHPPIHVLAPNAQMAEWAAHQGYAIILSSYQPDGAIGRDMRRFVDFGGNAADSPVARFCLVAESDAEARKRASPLVTALCGRLRDGGLAGQAYGVSQEADLDPQRFYEETAIIGGPETVARRVASLRDSHGVRYINLRPSFWGSCPLAWQQETVELFATEAVSCLG